MGQYSNVKLEMQILFKKEVEFYPHLDWHGSNMISLKQSS